MSDSEFTLPDTLFTRERFCNQLSSTQARLPLFKETIESVNQFLHAEFRQGHYIRDLVWARARFIDDLLHCAWSLFDWDDNDISLVAVGGYGRKELHPHSDIDILILMREDCVERYKENIEAFITLLWDMNLDIGHSVRTIDECHNEAANDITIATNLMESRTLTGSADLRQTMMTEVGPDKIWPSQEFFRAKWNEQIERHRKHGNSEYNLEPNVKSSPGGLRDVQMIGWVAKRHFEETSIEGLQERGFMRQEEMDMLNGGMDFLWQVRYALHMISGREEDRLLFDHQRTLATMFGFEDDDARLAVERFMQQYYRWAKRLGELNDVLMQHFDETILRACEAETILEINPRFRVRNGHIEVTNDKVFEKNPSSLMEIFVLMAQNPAISGVRASTIRLIRDNRDLIDEKFCADPRNNRYFMEILRSKEKVALQLRRMLRFRVLGKYLPEFGRIIGQMQHDLFHIYSVDAHSMEVVKNMRRFHYSDHQKRFPIASRIVRRLPKVELLYIAGLYHDVAKGRGGDHSTLGAVEARNFCKRHGLDRRDTNLVCWLVQNHLLMSAVAQRQDITDPDVIGEFAQKIGLQLRLDYLYLLTVADINATNPTLWNSWRASLMRQLYSETKRALRRGLGNPADKQEWIDETQSSAIDQLEDLGFIEEEIRDLWGDTGDDYFLREKVDDIIWHTEALAHHGDAKEPLILIKEGRDTDSEGASQIFVHAQNQDALFALMASALEQLDLSIQDARIYNSGADFSLDTFYVLDANGETIGEDPERIKEIEAFLTEHLQNPEKYLEVISKRTPRQMRLFSIPTQTSMSTDTARGCSVLEVMTPDRPGLLARIGKIFLDFGIQLQNAKIATLGERVEDLFFISDQNQQPINDAELCQAIQQAIRKELDEQASA